MGRKRNRNEKDLFERVWSEKRDGILEIISRATPTRRKAKTKMGLSLEELANFSGLSPRLIPNFVDFMARRGANIYARGNSVCTKNILPVTRWTHDNLLSLENFDAFGNEVKGYRFGVVSDTHIGSNRTNYEVLEAAYTHFAELGICDVLHLGNVLAGKASRNYSQADREVQGLSSQIALLKKRYPLVPSITTHFILGHKDRTYEKDHTNPAMDIVQARPDFNYLGVIEADLLFTPKKCKQLRLRMYNEKLRYTYGISYQPQKKITTMAGGDRPDVWLVGGSQQHWGSRYQNIEVRKLAGLQHQTMQMRDRAYSCNVGFFVFSVVPTRGKPQVYTYALNDYGPGPDPSVPEAKAKRSAA